MRYLNRRIVSISTIVATLLVIMVTIYTSFVDESYQRISLRNFFSTNTLGAIKQQIFLRKDLFESCSERPIFSLTEQENTPWSIAVNCDSSCSFVAKNSELNVSNTIKIVTDASQKNDADAKDIKILFSDIPHGWILFSVGSYKKAYIVFLNEKMLLEEEVVIPYLKHDIQLEPFPGNSIEYIGTTTDRQGSQYVAFASETRSELYIYSVQRPFLLKHVVPTNLNFDTSQQIFTGGCFKMFDEQQKEYLLDFESSNGG